MFFINLNVWSLAVMGMLLLVLAQIMINNLRR